MNPMIGTKFVAPGKKGTHYEVIDITKPFKCDAIVKLHNITDNIDVDIPLAQLMDLHTRFVFNTVTA